MKAIIATDSFKGCLTSLEAGQAAQAAFPEGEAKVIQVSDGGEGFSTVLTESLGGYFRTVSCHDPLGRPISAGYGVVNNGKTAVIETAAASGLGLLRKEELNPSLATSYGTGELISDALGFGVEEIWLGLGGSATCDGGTGMLEALGYRFITAGDICGILRKIVGLDATQRDKRLDHCKITGFYDVSVPFCGAGGAARMFAPQKGADPEMVVKLDSWMSGLCEIYSNFSGKTVATLNGAGAAGGIGGALGGVLGASMTRGISRVLDILDAGNEMKNCDLVITGEGRSDRQTLCGKVPQGVLEYLDRHSAKGGRPQIVLIAGQVTDRQTLLDAGFDAVLQITPDGTPLSEALDPSMAKANITSAVKEYLNDRLTLPKPRGFWE